MNASVQQELRRDPQPLELESLSAEEVQQTFVPVDRTHRRLYAAILLSGIVLATNILIVILNGSR